MPTQSKADLLILNGRLQVGSVTLNLFPSFILIFNMSKVSRSLAISYFDFQHFAPYVANRLINHLQIFVAFLLVKFESLVQEKCTFSVICIWNSFYNTRY
jgi:hypothetical protein